MRSLSLAANTSKILTMIHKIKVTTNWPQSRKKLDQASTGFLNKLSRRMQHHNKQKMSNMSPN